MSFEEAVALAGEIDAAGYVVCSVTCLYGGGMFGDTWRVGFRPHTMASGLLSAWSYDEWAYWQTEPGLSRMRATLPETV